MRKLTANDPQATLPETAEHQCEGAITERPPLPYLAALRAEINCAAATARLLRQQRIHLPAGHVGMRLQFGDGTSGRVYRETVIDRGATQDPCVLVVEFRLRAIRGRGHALFRWESLFNTPLLQVSPAWRWPAPRRRTHRHGGAWSRSREATHRHLGGRGRPGRASACPTGP